MNLLSSSDSVGAFLSGVICAGTGLGLRVTVTAAGAGSAGGKSTSVPSLKTGDDLSTWSEFL